MINFLILIGLGLLVFLVIYRAEQFTRTAFPHPVEPSFNKEPVAPMPSLRQGAETSGASQGDNFKAEAFQTLERKCAKLEELVAEKNQLLMRLEPELKDEHSHAKEFESLQGVLQQQIEELKKLNKALKDELAQALQENARLQAGLSGSLSLEKVREASPIVHAAPDVSSVKLRDIFDEDKNKA